MTSSDLIAVSTCRSRADAQTAKGILDEAGIESLIQSDPSITRWGPTQGKHFAESNATQLMVRAEDVDRAAGALSRRHQSSH